MTVPALVSITPIHVGDLLADVEVMPIYVHVIDHPDARVLVDTGLTELHPAVAGLDPRPHPLVDEGFDLAGVDIVEGPDHPTVIAGDTAVWFGELDEPTTEGRMLLRSLTPELVWLTHSQEPWRPEALRSRLERADHHDEEISDGMGMPNPGSSGTASRPSRRA